VRSVKYVDKLVVNPAVEAVNLQETALAFIFTLNDVYSWRPANPISIDFSGNWVILRNYDIILFL